MTSFIVTYHKYITQALLFIIALNAAVPYLLRSNFDKMRLFSRIGYFIYWMGWAALLFSGVMAFMFSGRVADTPFWVMVVATLLLGYLEAYRSVKSAKLWLEGNNALSFSFKVLIAEALVIGIVTYVAIAAK